MKYFLSVICFVIVHFTWAQQGEFNFEQAWEQVYRQELQHLPKSARVKVDSIFEAASRLQVPRQQTKSLIYQAKYELLLEEKAHKKLVNRFNTGIAELPTPYRNILQNQLAELLQNLYQQNRWKIDERSKLADPAGEIDTWDKSRFFEEIKSLYMASLELPDSLITAPLGDYENLIKPVNDARKFRPLLIDLLAHNALEFFTEEENERERPADSYVINDRLLLNTPDKFVKATLSHADSNSYHLAALKIYQQLTRIHLTDETLWPITDLSLQRLKFLKDKGSIPRIEERYRRALAGLRYMLDTDSAAVMPYLEVARFEYSLGEQYSPRNNLVYRFKKVEAKAICDSILNKFPESEFTNEARLLRDAINHPKLELQAEKFLLPNEPSKLLASYQNYDQLFFQTYKVKPEQYDEFIRLMTDSARLATLKTLTTAKDWEASLKNEQDYQEHRQEVFFPAHGLGSYLVMAFANKEKTQPLAFEMVQVTRLAMAKSHDPYQKTFRVFDRHTGASISGVDVHFFASPNRNRKGMDQHYTTDDAGMISFTNNNWRSNVRITLTNAEDSVRLENNYLNQDQVINKPDNSAYTVEAQLFSDRAIYRPGQEMYFKAIVFKQKPDGSTVIPNEQVTITLYDPNDEDIWYEHFTTNEFGSVAGKVDLPKAGLTGEYYLEIEAEDLDRTVFDDADNDLESEYNFRVEEYKRPKFEITFPQVEEVYQFNDSVFVKGQATALAGSQLTGAKVTYKVERSRVSYSYYDRYNAKSTRVAKGELKTNEKGEFVIPFKALIDSLDLKDADTKFQYNISVSVTDINGETRENSTSLTVAKNLYAVKINGRDRYVKSADSLKFPIDIKSLNGAKQAIGGTFTIEKLQAPSFVKRTSPWYNAADYQAFTKAEHDKLFPHWPYENEKDPTQWPVSRRLLEQTIAPGAESHFKVGGTENWPSGYYKATFKTQPSLGDSLIAHQVFLLYEANPLQLPDKALFEASLDKNQYEVGDTAIVTIGSAAAELGVHLTIDRESGVTHQNIRLRNEVKQLRIPILPGDEAGIMLYYYHVAFNDYEKGQLEINVIKKWPKLILETGTFRNKLQPGSPEQWSFKVKGEDGEAASAELLASMYDASLDQFSALNWRFKPFYEVGRSKYSRSDEMGMFRSENFDKVTYHISYQPQIKVYDRWDWFGLNVRNPGYSQNRYVDDLRYRRNARPVINSEMRDLPQGTIQGIVFDEVGHAIVGATVVIAGSTTGDIVDEKGGFSLLAKKGDKLYIRFLGYETFSLTLSDDNFYTITMLPDYTELGEVVVVGEALEERKALTSSVVRIADDQEITMDLELEFEGDEVFMIVEESAKPDRLNSRVAGLKGWDDIGSPGATIKIRGNSSIDAESVPLMIVDGVPLTSQVALDTSLIASVKALPGIEATTLYGTRAANGVIIITTKKEEARQNALLAQVKARTDLKETAFFFPQLKTNEEGEVSFGFKSPESLTRWKLQLLAHNKNLASAIRRKTVVTQKDLMLLPNAPRFLREGDELTFSAKLASLSADTLNGFVKLELFDAVTEDPVQSVIQSPTSNSNFRVLPKGNAEVSWNLQIPEGLQAVRYRIVAVAGDFSDGEENILPVLSKRMLVQESLPLWVNAKSTKTFTLDKLRNPQSATLTNHRLTLNVTTNPVWEAIRSLPYLVEYPYECAEQTFSRFYANSLGQHIIEQQPAIQQVFEQWKAAGQLTSKLDQNQELKAMLIEETPWLREAKSETEQQKRMAKLFEAENLAQGLEASLDKLREMQMPSGGFPWFAGSDRANRYITQHIVIGLLHLKQLTGTDDFNSIYNAGLEFMAKELAKDYDRLLRRKNVNPDEKHISYYQTQYLYALSLLDEKTGDKEERTALAFYKKQAYKYWPEMNLQSRAMIALFAQHNGDKRQTKRIMRSLKQYAIESEEMGNYWKTNVSGWYNWQAPIETQALMIEAFTKLTKDEKFVNGLRQWLLNHKRVNSWRSTKATTEAIYALLFTGEDWAEPNNAVSVRAGAEQVLSPEITESGAEAGTGNMQKIWAADEVNAELANVVIENGGKMQVWGGLHWQYFEDLDQITPAMGPLNVEKQLFKVQQTATGEELQTIDETTALKVGDLVRVRIVLKTDRVMEFIHLKDMRAAGFEPVNVLSGYRWQGGLGYYESTRDAATNFFIEHLPKGTFVFEYDLRANNQGNFSNGITSLQNMYAPEFSSHSEGIRVKIGK